ncbi:MAG: hypothetical protein HY785_11150 [Oscillatoriophycideae cyanobacterium NC_groundwater_1537_Pr4_S-0.65um_50_18]|nr:hypothetical protein [Oscillatoriophycideae cyanobacterium NC_groundwater_1537_Pr4_S-0.65um_50_18]
MRDKSDRYQVQTVPTLVPAKRLGSYLVDAGLLTADQINVILNDQQATGMRFGEIATARGWLKEQTIEWIVQKVVEPERHMPTTSSGAAKTAVRPTPEPQTIRPNSLNILRETAAEPEEAEQRRNPPTDTKKPAARRETPISKPLPPVKSPDGDVNWVG